ncbi:MAG: FAD:protein FMN transferase [Melioribacteraceae bacterium]|nr:FAD:protein FMN transferase [Melioribacteraceae bacterium]
MKIGNLVKNKFLFLLNSWVSRTLIISFILLIFISCQNNNNKVAYSISGSTMGTTYSIKFIDIDGSADLPMIQANVDSILAKVNQQMSTYIKTSEISLFNANKDTSWFIISHDFAIVLAEAIEIYKQTDGYYDITIGPLVNLWGFGPAVPSNTIPNYKSIQKAKKLVGTSKIKVDTLHNSIKKTMPDLYCDLSSIAKGFGVDKVGQYLTEREINNFMIEIGGEVRTKGINENSEKWRIGISTPLSDGLQKIISISDMSVATSGDYLNYFEKNGVRYSHLINAKTGRPINHNLASVTVLNKNCSTADALATAINVMGPEVGYKFALEKKLPIFMIVREGNGFVEKMTPEFENFILERKQ